MATDARRGNDPSNVLTEIEEDFEALAALLQTQIDALEGQPGQDVVLTHLRAARQAALQGANRAADANG